VKRGRGRGIEGLPLFVGEAAHRGRRGVFSVGEEALADGLAVYPVGRPSCRLVYPAPQWFVALQSIASLIARHPVPVRLNASVGCSWWGWGWGGGGGGV
jgi:hypothetical protein